MIKEHIPVHNLLIPETRQKTRAYAQGVHTESEAEEMMIELKHNKFFAALLEAGDTMCSALKTMTTLIKENDFKCSVQDVLDMIAWKNDMRRYYDEEVEDES